ncbi:lanthionine synthetase LanC family protein [Streptomyces sp. NPDC001568]|uniref:lanthionine synthetase LanC family protein n=1 Tax=Streptomyces sp. NPDC001568 TaxID=3364588 RepID=UPI0036CCFB1B
MTTARAAAAATALGIAESLADPYAVARNLPAAHVHTLGDGLAGTALLHARLSTVEPAGAHRALAHWETAADALGRAGSVGADGVYRGRGGLAASLIIGAAHLPRGVVPRDAVRDGTRWLSRRAEQIVAGATSARGRARTPLPTGVYDTLRGLSGVGRVLLVASQGGWAAEAAPGLTAALTLLTAMILQGTADRPGWAARASGPPAPAPGPVPAGASATGMAHGIAGPLALLALAERAGASVPGRRRAIEAAADWLLQHRADASWPCWTPDGPPGGRRDAWCYGAPGITRALDLAASALGRDQYAREALDCLHALAGRDPGTWDTRGAGLCHGSAGVLMAALRGHCPALAESACERTVELLAGQCPDSRSRRTGFLTGAAGAALALTHYADLPARDSRAPWDSLLLTV